MAFERQEAVVVNSRGNAARVDEALNNIEALNARYDVLNVETPNFAAGYFGSAQEITANDLLGLFNSWNALRAAAPSQVSAFRAAIRKIR